MLKSDQPYVEPDVASTKTRELEMQVRNHALQHRRRGADEKTFQALIENMLEAPPVLPGPSPTQVPAPDTATTARQAASKSSPRSMQGGHSPQRPPPRGVLGCAGSEQQTSKDTRLSKNHRASRLLNQAPSEGNSRGKELVRLEAGRCPKRWWAG